MQRRLGAEFFGTFWLTFAGCGSAVLAANFPSLGIGFLGVSLAFGLTVLTMAYAVGHVSGGHFNFCRYHWALGGRPLQGHRRSSLRPHTGGRRHRSGCGTLRDRLGQTRMGSGRVCVQRLRRSQSRKIRSGVVLPK